MAARCVLGGVLLVLALGALSETATGAPVGTVVVQNTGFETLAVDRNGTAWGHPTSAPTELWRSTDEARTFTKVTGWSSIGRRPWSISALSSGTLLVHYDTGFQFAFARSDDGGATWTHVLSLPCIAQDCSTRYRTLTQASIVDGGGDVYLGTYNNASGSPWPNYIYRSSDDGRTWTVVNQTTNHRHIHGLTWDPDTSRLYVLFGDSAGDGVWTSSDRGQTLAPLCTLYGCVAVDAFVAGGSLVFSTDNPFATNHVVRLNPSTGARTELFTLRYPSYSSASVGSIWLVGETHEPGMDLSVPSVHLYASDDNGTSWASVYSVAIPSTSSDYRMLVTGVFPNGDVAVASPGHGTAVLRFGAAPPPQAPVNTGLPVVSGSPVVGSVLSASQGSWSGSPSSFGYEWRRCNATGGSCVAIAGASSSSYTVATGDVGATLRVQVTATNTAGSATAESAATAVVTTPPTGGGGSFGATTPGTLSQAPGAGYKFGTPYVLGSAGTTSSFAFWARGGTAAQSFTPAIYSSTGSGPGALLAVGQTVTVPAGQTARWVTSSLPAVQLAAGTYYLVLQSGPTSSGAFVYYAAGAATDGVYNTNPATPSNPFGTFKTEPRLWSFQVTTS